MFKLFEKILPRFRKDNPNTESSAPNTITFTGVDEKTDLDRLVDIQARYPYAEFGILVSVSRTGNEPRYPDLSILDRIKECGPINLSCHVCGCTLLEPTLLYGDFGYLDQYLCGNLHMFKRIQLNVGNELGRMVKRFGRRVRIGSHEGVREVIIQQKKRIISRAWLIGKRRTKISVLIDPSGGNGRESKLMPIKRFLRTGYAGGINPSNAARKFLQLKNSGVCGDFWIDMESGVRTDGWFDLDKVEAVLKEIDPLQKILDQKRTTSTTHD